VVDGCVLWGVGLWASGAWCRFCGFVASLVGGADICVVIGLLLFVALDDKLCKVEACWREWACIGWLVRRIAREKC